ncbi:hypothetical protein F5I97DRAFT_763498 [Phlebopus sp. FC_14]|nr:hypothetical protein F5I97DRAFT_763498 [Phlebopus sp. FC_14]
MLSYTESIFAISAAIRVRLSFLVATRDKINIRTLRIVRLGASHMNSSNGAFLTALLSPYYRSSKQSYLSFIISMFIITPPSVRIIFPSHAHTDTEQPHSHALSFRVSFTCCSYTLTISYRKHPSFTPSSSLSPVTQIYIHCRSVLEGELVLLNHCPSRRPIAHCIRPTETLTPGREAPQPCVSIHLLLCFFVTVATPPLKLPSTAYFTAPPSLLPHPGGKT